MEDIFELNEKNIIKSLASFQLSINNLLELITKIKEIPSSFSHSDILKNELEEIKKYKEDTFLNLVAQYTPSISGEVLCPGDKSFPKSGNNRFAFKSRY